MNAPAAAKLQGAKLARLGRTKETIGLKFVMYGVPPGSLFGVYLRAPVRLQLTRLVVPRDMHERGVHVERVTTGKLAGWSSEIPVCCSVLHPCTCPVEGTPPSQRLVFWQMVPKGASIFVFMRTPLDATEDIDVRAYLFGGPP